MLSGRHKGETLVTLASTSLSTTSNLRRLGSIAVSATSSGLSGGSLELRRGNSSNAQERLVRHSRM